MKNTIIIIWVALALLVVTNLILSIGNNLTIQKRLKEGSLSTNQALLNYDTVYECGKVDGELYAKKESHVIYCQNEDDVFFATPKI